MLTLQIILDRLRQNLPELKLKYPIARIGVFGSYARGEATKESDVDIIVELNKTMGLDFVAMADEIEAFLGNKTDVVSKDGIKPKYFAVIEKEIVFI